MNTIQEALHELYEESYETLDMKKLNDYRNEIWKIAHNQPIITATGLFHIYNVNERDVDSIIRRLQNIEFISRVTKSRSGNYNFNNYIPGMGKLPESYWEITGQIKEK